MAEENLSIPSALGVLTIRGGVIFPGHVTPIIVQTPKLIKLVDDALAGEKIVVAIAQRNQENEDPGPEELYSIGTATQILRMLRFPDGSIRLLVQGIKRVRIGSFIKSTPYLIAEVEEIKEVLKRSKTLEANVRNVVSMFQQLVSIAPYLPDELSTVVMNIDDPSKLADFVATYANFEIGDKQSLLETIDPRERLERVIPLLSKEISILELGAKIRSQVKDELDKGQREFYLREQMKAIQKELGEYDDRTREVNELKAKIKDKKMPEDVEAVALKEVDRLKMIPPQAAEYTVVRTYLDWLINLPWADTTRDNLDIRRAKRILDEDHYNLKKVKERIVEFLAVRKMKNDSKGPILCFVGPPGVGKTSLGKSIARALGRKFIRISLGGVRDEAEIRGHRRTYVGALPGRIIQGIKNAGTNNPVFMIDEIDKIVADFGGDPSSALLEVLDPEQNFSFSDHYLEVPFDLSNVMFIATANITHTIIPALRDRMEIIHLPGYILEEKIEIAKRFLIPRQRNENGLNGYRIRITDSALRVIITQYTMEAGVRNLERAIGSIMRKIARKIASNSRFKATVGAEDIGKYLGPPSFYSEVAARSGEVGVATGLAWTPTGGEILFIESIRMPGKRGFQLTGLLGDVMKESGQAALSYIRSWSERLNLKRDFFENSDIHVHVPKGAIPKDGPSAGLAITLSLLSLLINKPIDPKVASTGEVTLTGRVLPVGGVREKVIAAKRAGIKEIILPAFNRKDLQEIPPHVRKGLEFHFVKKVDEAAKIVFRGLKF